MQDIIVLDSSPGIDLGAAIKAIRENPELDSLIVYEHLNSCFVDREVARNLKNLGFDGIILFPFAGMITQKSWMKSCADEDLRVFAGATRINSTGGDDDFTNGTMKRIYCPACDLGVRTFVAPEKKSDWVRDVLAGELDGDFVLYVPNFKLKLVGNGWHAFVGSARH